MTRFPRLSEPLAIPPLRLANRVTRAPLFTALATAEGLVSLPMLTHYGELAQGGAAMVVVANGLVDPAGALSPRSLRVDHDRCLPGLRRLARAIRTHGAAAVLQLNHGGRYARSANPVAPSPVPLSEGNLLDLWRSTLQAPDLEQQLAVVGEGLQLLARRPAPLTQEAIREVQARYARAAWRACQAGFDMVELHGANGYLPVQFLSRRTNRRRDRYGGSLANRMRFFLELFDALRAAVGPGFPVGCRLMVEEWMPGGVGLEESLVLAEHLARRGAAYLSLTAGTYESAWSPEVRRRTRRPGYLAGAARRFKERVGVPVIVAGRILTPKVAEGILKAGAADLVGLARPLLADAQWPVKALTAGGQGIRICRDCGGCFQRVLVSRPVACDNWLPGRSVEWTIMCREAEKPLHKVLIALDGSRDALLGVGYAARMLAGRPEVAITLFHVRDEETSPAAMAAAFAAARDLLAARGFEAAAVTERQVVRREGPARDILEEIGRGGYGTVVIGRRGLTRARQFLFGSVSHKVVQNARECAVWVVD